MMRLNKAALLVAGGMAVGMMGGVALATLGGLAVPIAIGPTVQGGGPYTEIGIGGDPSKGLASSVVINREGQRPGNSTDDGPALFVSSNKFAAARFEGSPGVNPIVASARAGSVFTHTEVKNTSGNKRNNVALTSVGAVVIKGKDQNNAPELDSVRLSIQNGVLTARFANGNEVVLATEND